MHDAARLATAGRRRDALRLGKSVARQVVGYMKAPTNVSNSVGSPPFWVDPATVERIERQLAGNGERRSRGGITRPRLEQPPLRSGAVEILLYISGSSMNCGRATTALQTLLREFPSDAVRFRVIDVLHDMDGATRDRVLFTPTLIFTDHQQRKTRVLGDLSNPKVLWDLLLAAGLEPI